MAYAHVQSIFFPNVSGSATLTLQPTSQGGANFTTGSRVFAGLEYFQNGADPARTVVSVTNQSATPITFAQPASNQYATDTGAVVVDIPVMPAGVTSILITLSASPAFGALGFVSEYTGLGTGAADGASSLINTSAPTTGDAVVSGSASNAAQPAICWGVAFDAIANSVPTNGTGFTSRLAAAGCAVEDKRLTATGSQQTTFTNASGGARTFIAFMIMADEPGGGGGITMMGAMCL